MGDDERQPDHTEDPRGQETGKSGYPESAPAGAHDDDAQDGDEQPTGDKPDGES